MSGARLLRILAASVMLGTLLLAPGGCATTIPSVTSAHSSPGQASARAIAFAPLSGPPPPVADRLATAFASASAERGMPLAPYRRNRSAYVVKGFMSVVPGEDGTTALYVWDVLSPDLKRLYRISGQTTDPARADDPWAALSQDSLDAIAGSTLDQLAVWMAARQP